jgi:hypothetical protein
MAIKRNNFTTQITLAMDKAAFGATTTIDLYVILPRLGAVQQQLQRKMLDP